MEPGGGRAEACIDVGPCRRMADISHKPQGPGGREEQQAAAQGRSQAAPREGQQADGQHAVAIRFCGHHPHRRHGEGKPGRNVARPADRHDGGQEKTNDRLAHGGIVPIIRSAQPQHRRQAEGKEQRLRGRQPQDPQQTIDPKEAQRGNNDPEQHQRAPLDAEEMEGRFSSQVEIQGHAALIIEVGRLSQTLAIGRLGQVAGIPTEKLTVAVA